MVPEWISKIGAASFLVGILLMYVSGQARPGTMDAVNYLGIAFAVLGVVGWFISGMDRTQVMEWLRSGLMALLIALTIRWAIAEPYRIPSGSMETTLHGDPRFGRGDRVFVNKWIYGLRFPFMNRRIFYGAPVQRWDIVVFQTVEEDAIHRTLVKRVVGMPGERIQIRNGRIYADGNPLDFPDALPPDVYYTTPLDGPYGVQPADRFSLIPEGHYLVLGDNSAYSRDGRYFGWLPQEHIVGRVSGIWWPPQRWRDFTGFSRAWWWRLSILLIAGFVVLRMLVGRSVPIPVSTEGSASAHLLVSYLHYGFHVPMTGRCLFSWRRPSRGELVLYSAGTGANKTLLCGRIAGMPGERVTMQDGVLTVDDKPVSLPPPAPKCYANAHPDARYARMKPKEYTVVPEKHYFILADNVAEDALPADSRHYGWIPQRAVLGRAVCCWWPIRLAGKR